MGYCAASFKFREDRAKILLYLSKCSSQRRSIYCKILFSRIFTFVKERKNKDKSKNAAKAKNIVTTTSPLDMLWKLSDAFNILGNVMIAIVISTRIPNE